LTLHKKTLSYLFLSILFLSMRYFFIKDIQNVFLNILHEGIYIGGWVFLWEFFTNIFITTREVQIEYKLYRRLYQSEVKFIYNK
jgi:polyferredoxin